MTLYDANARERMILQVIKGYHGLVNQFVFLVEAVFVKQALVKVSSSSIPIGSAACTSCRHAYCGDCEQCSAPKHFSDYWICHHCGELNRRV
jgi:hypothetical protein